MKFIRNLLAVYFLRLALARRNDAYSIYDEYEDTEIGQCLGDFAMTLSRFHQAVAMRLAVTGE